MLTLGSTSKYSAIIFCVNPLLFRISIQKNKTAFQIAGGKLAELHVNYEAVSPYSEIQIETKGGLPIIE